jgi:hypothetical protein
MKHIVAGCTTFVPSEYTNRLNKVAGYIHWLIRKHVGLQVTDNYYELIPECPYISTIPLLCAMYWFS